MAPDTVLAWQKLYGAVAVLAAICSACAFLKTCYDVRTAVLRPPQNSVAGWILWLPRVWLHFQLVDFLGFPSVPVSRSCMRTIVDSGRLCLRRLLNRPPDSPPS